MGLRVGGGRPVAAAEVGLLAGGLRLGRRGLFLQAVGLVKPYAGTIRTALHGALQCVLHDFLSGNIEFFHDVPPRH